MVIRRILILLLTPLILIPAIFVAIPMVVWHAVKVLAFRIQNRGRVYFV